MVALMFSFEVSLQQAVELFVGDLAIVVRVQSLKDLGTDVDVTVIVDHLNHLGELIAVQCSVSLGVEVGEYLVNGQPFCRNHFLQVVQKLLAHFVHIALSLWPLLLSESTGENFFLEDPLPTPTITFFEGETTFDELNTHFTDPDSIRELDGDPSRHFDQVTLRLDIPRSFAKQHFIVHQPHSPHIVFHGVRLSHQDLG